MLETLQAHQPERVAFVMPEIFKRTEETPEIIVKQQQQQQQSEDENDARELQADDDRDVERYHKKAEPQPEHPPEWYI